MNLRNRLAVLVLASVGAMAPAAASAIAGDPRTAVDREDAVPPRAKAASARLLLHLMPGPLERSGLRIDGQPDASGRIKLTTGPGVPLEVLLGDGAPTALRGGRLPLPGLVLRRADGSRSPALALAPAHTGRLDFDLVDGAGGIWLRLRHGMRSPDARADGLRLFTADLRAGPALAAWSGHPIEGTLLSGVSLQAALAMADGDSDVIAMRSKHAATKSCAVPNWPGTPGYVTDVLLTSIDSVDVLRCRRIGSHSDACDGPGGGADEIVVVPSTTLRNSLAADASEVPWYTRFSGVFAPYGNDQHPYLVWNLYRLSADGQLEQVARSALKHAFATENLHCVEPCSNSHILGRGCSDRYNAASNDWLSILTPRREVIAASGIWGRCRSVLDADCANGLDPLDFDAWAHRMRVPEQAIDPSLHPGARWFIDAWYVIRDDQDLLNTMGLVEVGFSHATGSWRAAMTGSYRSGSVVSMWLDSEPAAPRSQLGRLVSAEGEVEVGVRVVRLAGGGHRYDYAVMNQSFARSASTGSEPNLEVLDNRGFDRLLLPTSLAAQPQFADGDSDPANDWVAGNRIDGHDWTAPTGNSLDWGSLYRFSIVSDAPPAAGQLQLRIAAGGAPATHAIDTLLPDADWLFGDGFE